MHKRILYILNIAAWMAVVLYTITAIFLHVGLDEDLYFKLQMRENVPETAGISEADLQKLDNHLARCLKGSYFWNEEDGGAPLAVTVHGVKQPAFNDREIIHMQDCQRLFDTLRSANWALLTGWFLLQILSSVYSWLCEIKDAVQWTPKQLWIGSGIILVPLAVFALWAAIDFSSAFTFFHKLLFTNDLWLLDPRTDLLINICPSSMFAGMGLRIALYSAGILLGVPLLASLLNRIFDKRKKEQNERSHL